MGKQPIDCSKDVPLIQQSAKDECDINLIVASAKRGADISHLATKTGVYGDFTHLPDYRESLLIVNQARDAFMALDANVRKRFGNDPAEMLDFLNDPKNREEAVKLGLVNPKAVSDLKDELGSVPITAEELAAIRKARAIPADSKSKKAKAAGDEE